MHTNPHTKADCALPAVAHSSQNLIPRELILSFPVTSADREALLDLRSLKELQSMPLEISCSQGLQRLTRLLPSPGNTGMAISSWLNSRPMGRLSCFPPGSAAVATSSLGLKLWREWLLGPT